MAGGDESVSTVVAGTGHDNDAAALHPGGGIGHGAPGVLHKFDAGNAASNRQTVRFSHLGSREQFNHRRASLATDPSTEQFELIDCAATSLWRLAKI